MISMAAGYKVQVSTGCSNPRITQPLHLQGVSIYDLGPSLGGP